MKQYASKKAHTQAHNQVNSSNKPFFSPNPKHPFFTIQKKVRAKKEAILQHIHGDGQLGDIEWGELDQVVVPKLGEDRLMLEVLRDFGGWNANNIPAKKAKIDADRTDLIKYLTKKYKDIVVYKHGTGTILKANSSITIPTFDAYKNKYLIKQEPIEESETKIVTDQSNIGGYTGANPRGIIRVAWTFDDGPYISAPNDFTTQLQSDLDSLGITGVTWFLVRSRLNTQSDYNRLRSIQNQGGEIAIHELDPEGNKYYWFNGHDKPYPNIEQAVNDLRTFKQELNNAGIRVKFVRLPGGIHSEISSYLKKRGVPNAAQAAREIIAGNTGYDWKVEQDYKYLMNALSSLGLKLWNGSGRGLPEIGLPLSSNSWQAESVGIRSTKRGADNVTRHQAPARKSMSEYKLGIFENKVDKIAQTGINDSVVVLAHDTSQEDITEVMADVNTMNAYAKSKQVLIEYLTMSQLYQKIR